MAKKTKAMEELDEREKIRKRFKITFHKNMDLKSMSKQWVDGVKKNPNLVTQNPMIASIMTIAAVSINSNEAVVVANEVAAKAKNIATITTTLISSANPVTPNPSYAGTVSAQAATKVAMEIKNEVVKETKNKVLELLASLPKNLPV